MNKRSQVAKYMIFDTLGALCAWALFYVYRKLVIEQNSLAHFAEIKFDSNFWIALALLPALWVSSYFITGFYRDIFHRSRLIELGQTMLISIIGVTVIFFVLILDDTIVSYTNYYSSYFTLLLFHFLLTYIPRLIITSSTAHKIQKRKIGFNTIIIGSNERALKIFNELNSAEPSTGCKFVGFVKVENSDDYLLEKELPLLGSLDDLGRLINSLNVEEIIVAIETSEHNKIQKILSILDFQKVTVRAIPDMYDILAGTVKTSTIFTSPLVKISNGLMPAWQENLKRLIDVVFSLLAIALLLPFFPFIYLGVRFSSKGPVFYSQKRVGRYGKMFTIYKLRSMYLNAEKHGPALSSNNDPRITPFGQFMRRTHIDEIPQFVNVLIGDMSLVGPRPERLVYIEQIKKVAPHVAQLQRLRPGITSWGQVQYGYASSIDQMVERLQYDMIYLKNISLYLDFKILIYTIIACLKGKGK